MTTTAVFAEIIVIGLQVEAWLALYVVALLDSEWVPDGVEQWIALITIVAVAAAYMLGVVGDRIADNVFRWKQTLALVRRKLSHAPDQPPVPTNEFGDQRLFVLQHASDGVVAFVEYQRSKLRVARATTVNAAICAPAVVILLLGTDAGAALVACLVAAMGLAIAVLAWSAVKIGGAGEDVLEKAHKIVEEQVDRTR